MPTKTAVKKPAATSRKPRSKYIPGQYVYAFGEAYGLGKPLLGGKGAGLAEMAHIGIRIPDGFTITTEACTLYYDSGRKSPKVSKSRSKMVSRLSKRELERLSAKVRSRFLSLSAPALESLCLV